MNKGIGNVIKIIDEYKIIINFGKNIVNKNDCVFIYGKDNSIKDLDGTVIGTYDICKAKLSVTEVYEHFSVCEALPQSSNKQTLFINTMALSPLLEDTHKKIKLNIDPSQINRVKTIDNAIRIGDIVKLN